MKVAPVQLLLSLLQLAGGGPEGIWKGDGNGWGKDLPVLSQRDDIRERLGIEFPFIKVVSVLKKQYYESSIFRIT